MKIYTDVRCEPVYRPALSTVFCAKTELLDFPKVKYHHCNNIL